MFKKKSLCTYKHPILGLVVGGRVQIPSRTVQTKDITQRVGMKRMKAVPLIGQIGNQAKRYVMLTVCDGYESKHQSIEISPIQMSRVKLQSENVPRSISTTILVLIFHFWNVRSLNGI
jgi:hypothetical protein